MNSFKSKALSFVRSESGKNFLLVFATALAVRLLYFYEQTLNPLYDYPFGDTAIYIDRAREILRGDIVGSYVFTYGGEAFYPYFLSIVFLIFGENLIAVQVIQYIIGALSCSFLFLTGSKLYGKNIGLVLGFWASIFSPWLFHEGLVLTGAFSIFFFILSIYLLVLLLENKTLSLAVLCGIALGMAVVARPNILLIAPVFFLFTLLALNWNFKSKVPYGLVVGVLLIIAPITMRNYIVSKDFVLISSGAGINLFIGNNENSYGIFDVPRELGVVNEKSMYVSAHKAAERMAGKSLKPSEGSKYWSSKAVDYIKNDTKSWLSLMVRKFKLFWNDKEITNLYKYGFFQEFSLLLKNPLGSFGLLAITGLIGLGWMLVSGSKKDKVLPAIIIVYMLSVVIFFVSSRIKVPVSVPLFLCAGYMLSRLKDIDVKDKIIMTCLVVILSVFVFQDYRGNVSKVVNSYSFNYYHAAKKFSNSGKFTDALKYYDKGLLDSPNSPILLMEAGDVALKAEMPGRAIIYYEKVVKSGYIESLPAGYQFSWNNQMDMFVYKAMMELGMLYGRARDFDSSIAILEKAYSLFSYDVKPLLYIGESYERKGSLEEALKYYERYLSSASSVMLENRVLEIKKLLGQ